MRRYCCLLLCACTTLAPGESLIDHAAWVEVPADGDLIDALDDCTRAAWSVPSDFVDVDTQEGCTWQVLEQPSLGRVPKDSVLHLFAWHEPLSSDVPDVQAHMRVTVGEVVLLDVRPDIPSPGAFFNVRQALDRPVPQGAPVRLHVHNHDDNTYALRTLERDDL